MRMIVVQLWNVHGQECVAVAEHFAPRGAAHCRAAALRLLFAPQQQRVFRRFACNRTHSARACFIH